MRWTIGIRIPAGKRDFCKTPRQAVGPIQPPNQQVMGAVSVEVNGSGCEALKSPSSGDEIKKKWRYISTPTMCHNVEYRENFALLPHQIKRNFVQRLAILNTACRQTGGQTWSSEAHFPMFCHESSRKAYSKIFIEQKLFYWYNIYDHQNV